MIARALAALLALAAIAWHGGAQAAITCTVASSVDLAAAYVPANPGNTVMPGSSVVTCQRNAGADPTSVSFTLANNNGINALGQQNRARLGATANRINYDLFQDAACSDPWANGVADRIGNPAVPATTLTLTGFLPSSRTVFWWGCIPSGQAAGAAGTYTDTVTATVRPPNGGNTDVFTVSIIKPATCTISTLPGTLVFNYTALGPVQNASTPFGVTCTTLLPYTMSLDATAGVVVGIQYTLGLSAAGGTGTGVQQNYQVTGTAAAGQAGTCTGANCSGSQQRTLTITY